MEEIRILHRWKRFQQKFISPYMEESGISGHLFLFVLPQKANRSGSDQEPHIEKSDRGGRK
jgi:hypothetical protein